MLERGQLLLDQQDAREQLLGRRTDTIPPVEGRVDVDQLPDDRRDVRLGSRTAVVRFRLGRLPTQVRMVAAGHGCPQWGAHAI